MNQLRDELAAEFDRLPPHSIDSEMCLLASVSLDRRAWEDCRRIVTRDSFYQADHQIIWDAVCGMYERGSPVDIVLLREELLRLGVFEEVGGRSYLAQVIGTVPSAAHGPHYAEMVAELGRRRRLIEVSNDVLRRAYEPTRNADPSAEILQRAMGEFAKVCQAGNRGRAQRLAEVLTEVRVQMSDGGTPLVPTGFRDFDALSGGIGLGEMVLIGARPSMGKSTLVKQIGLRAARAGVPSAIISLEEGKAKIARNILSSEARIDNHRIRQPHRLSQQDWVEVDAAISKLEGVELYLVDGARRLHDIAAEASLLVARHNIQLLIIDYLQRVQAGGKDAYERAGNAATGVSDLLKELNVAGIVPVQLNRGVESREEKRPTMADLRDSGQIEQDADGVVFLYRDDYYRAADDAYEPTGVAELIIAKWRDGVRGKTVRLRSCLHYQTFEDLDIDPLGASSIEGAFL